MKQQRKCDMHGHECHRVCSRATCSSASASRWPASRTRTARSASARDPKTSALDVNCRAHELDNLYVVDGSFFPSSRPVNPALTIMANALRVGDTCASAERLGVRRSSMKPAPRSPRRRSSRCRRRLAGRRRGPRRGLPRSRRSAHDRLRHGPLASPSTRDVLTSRRSRDVEVAGRGLRAPRGRLRPARRGSCACARRRAASS